MTDDTTNDTTDATTGDDTPDTPETIDAAQAGAPVAGGPGPADDDIAHLPYEQARDELVTIVAQLEAGRTDLEESMRLWERGEALAEHCSRWLDGAQARLETRMDERASAG